MESESERLLRLEQFVTLTQKMRAADKAYFKARREGRNPKPELIAAQRLERDVDHALTRLLESPKAEQWQLFDEGIPY